MPEPRGWWVGARCPNCGLPVRTTNKHGHYTYHPDTATVTIRHTIRACPQTHKVESPQTP